jgi:hypothetical protein
MASNKRARRQIDIASKVLPSIETGGDPASPLPNGRKNVETQHHRRYKSWTPEPRDDDEFNAWARKHLGERWCELREDRDEKDPP